MTKSDTTVELSLTELDAIFESFYYLYQQYEMYKDPETIKRLETINRAARKLERVYVKLYKSK